MTKLPVDYYTPRPAWRTFLPKLWRGTIIGGSHGIGVISAWVILTAIAVTTAAVIVFIIAADQVIALGEIDGPPPVFIPLLAGFFAVIGVIIALILSTLCTIIVTCVCVTLDTIRRPLRLPAAAVPILFGGAVAALWVLKTLLEGESWAIVARNSLIASVAITGVLCTYWLPMMFSENVLRLATWVGAKLIARLPSRWKKRLHVPSAVGEV